MPNLHEDLDTLNELNNYRERARLLREQGLNSLKGIDKIVEINQGRKLAKRGEAEPPQKEFEIFWRDDSNIPPRGYDDWIASGNEIEAALLVKVQNHRDLSDNDHTNNTAQAASALVKKLESIELKHIFNVEMDPSKGLDIQQTVPILTAARVLQALTGRAETVFSKATMLCYYRIVRELHHSNGAARVGSGGGKSAFVTSECLRAVLSLEHAITQTVQYLKHTLNLYRKHKDLEKMVESLGDPNPEHPLHQWAEAVIKRMCLDCYLSTNPRSRQIALFWNTRAKKKEAANNNRETANLLLVPNGEYKLKNIKQFFNKLRGYLKAALKEAVKATDEALKAIEKYRQEDSPFTETSTNIAPELDENYKGGTFKDKKKQLAEVGRWYMHTQSSYLHSREVIKNSLRALRKAALIFDQEDMTLEEILTALIEHIEKYPSHIHALIKPTKDYLVGVIEHELRASSDQFDAGELVFAAAAYGRLVDWQGNELLDNAVEKLVASLPRNGRLLTKKPFHASRRGYRMQPIGCEMTRSLAQLLQHTNFAVAPEIVGRMLKIFEDNQIDMDESMDKKQFLGWNFEGAPEPEKPCIWVTAVSVLALDRMVRMLNTRINEMVYKNFEVLRPEAQSGKMTLNDLIYPDYGLNLGYFPKHTKDYPHQLSIPIYLELMRAHLMRATLPNSYLKDDLKLPDGKEKVYSAIFYGPPGTGKTTLAQAMALSAQVPLIMLSPSDLMVQGQEQIEGRARDVFNALSMLTQTIILLDEFEPVLKSRTEVEAADATFGFLLAGMLPKLTKLHDSAKKQALAFCLATNYLGKIGKAAGRSGRFDYRIPVYPPCRLSRAGTLLYRLIRVKPDFELDERQKEEFIKLVVATAGENASELGGSFFKIKENGNGKPATSQSKYLDKLTGTETESVTIETERFTAIKNLANLWSQNASHANGNEVAEIQWQADYENAGIAEGQPLPTEVKPFLCVP